MRISVTGAAGQLGTALVRSFTAAGAAVEGITRTGFDLDYPHRLRFAADLVVNAAAWTDVDACAREPELAMVRNGRAVEILAAAAVGAGARFIQISTNEVFDGAQRRPYREDDVPHPINPYGASKLVGEQAALAVGGSIVRTAWIFGGPRSFPARIRAAAALAIAQGRPLRVVTDEIGNPTPVDALADRIAMLVFNSHELPRILHLAGIPPVSRHLWATRILAAAGLAAPEPTTLSEYVRDSHPPPRGVLDTSLATALGLPQISWDAAAIIEPSHGVDD